MGRAQKLKQQRKREELEKAEKKKKRKMFIFKVGLTAILTGVFLSGMVFAFNKWVDKKNEEERKNNIKSYKTGERQYSQSPDMQIDVKKKYTASFETTMGNFKIELFAKDAPVTVNNFIVLAKDKFYDGLTFHRIIKDFMIQGGCLKGDGTGDPGYKFEDEINVKTLGLSDDEIKKLEEQGYEYKDNLDSHKLIKGILAMANSGPNTNGSQFFIITKDETSRLNGKHTAFGQVTEGMDVVMKISEAETDEQDKPKTEVKILKIIIEEK